MQQRKVRGNTWCIDTGRTHIPFYKLDAKHIVLLDSGWYAREGDALEAFLDQTGYKVHSILLTHAHEDHMGNVKRLWETHRCEVVASLTEAIMMGSARAMRLNFGDIPTVMVDYLFRGQFFSPQRTIPMDATKVEAGGATFGVIPSPGHSPGHICLVTPDDVLYVGDVLMSADVVGHRVRMPYAFLMDQMLESMARVAALSHPAYILAHSAVVDSLDESYAANAQHYYDCLTAFYDLLETPLATDEIIVAALAHFRLRVDTTIRHTFVRQNCGMYLQQLVQIGAVALEIRDDVLLYAQQDRAALDQCFAHMPVKLLCPKAAEKSNTDSI